MPSQCKPALRKQVLERGHHVSCPLYVDARVKPTANGGKLWPESHQEVTDEAEEEFGVGGGEVEAMD
jgi:hypothetical protein